MKLLKNIYPAQAFFLFIFPSIAGCGPNLSEEQAYDIIREQLKYPQSYFSTIFAASAEGIYERRPIIYEGVIKLITDRYIVYNKELSENKFNENVYAYYNVTDKGKDYIRNEPVFWFMGNRFTINIALSIINLKAIKEVLIDEQNYTAEVSYLESYEKNEPLYSLVCKDDSYCVDLYKIGKTMEKTIKLKKYDKGWRIIR